MRVERFLKKIYSTFKYEKKFWYNMRIIYALYVLYFMQLWKLYESCFDRTSNERLAYFIIYYTMYSAEITMRYEIDFP